MNQIFIFGAGKQGKDLLSLLNRIGIPNVIAFIDNDTEKQKEIIAGKKCLCIQEAIVLGAQNELVIVSCTHYQEIEKQLITLNFNHIFCWSKVLPNPAYCSPMVQYESDYKNVCPFNKYDSPYPDITQIHKNEEELFDKDKKVMDINFNILQQFELIKKMQKLSIPEWIDNAGEYRYSYNNGWFEKGSADALCYMIQILEPKKIIEVGSGYSTAVMLDTNEKYFNNSIHIISIEPRTDRLKSLIKQSDKMTIVESEIQEISVDFFEVLEKDDILFIDSSHVSKIGSDVNYILFEILPRIKRGVYIHFHDMFYPFVYPKEWVYDGNAYNELYLLRAFLMNNEAYSVQLFGDMLWQKDVKGIDKNLIGCGAGSLWIKKN